METFKKGSLVRMTAEYKKVMGGDCLKKGKHTGPYFDGECFACSSGHMKEFGDCIGIVEGPINYNNDGENDPNKFGPELDVRWQPSKLRYAYAPMYLELVERKPINKSKDRLGWMYWPTVYYYELKHRISAWWKMNNS